MRAKVFVTLKKEVLDPQGSAVRRALVSLGFDDVSEVRVGKLIEVELGKTDAAVAKGRLEEMSRRLLANPVIEDFRVELEDDE
jgi:phosphoribosylformylglycinamidine synthase